MKLISKTFTVFLLLLVSAALLIGAAAADTNYAVNGQFNSGTSGWTIIPDYATSASEVQSGVVTGPQHDGTYGNVYKVELTPRSDSHSSVSISQRIEASGINRISFWYLLSATHTPSGYDQNKPTMTVYWGGQVLDVIEAPFGSDTGWVHYSKSVPVSSSGGLTFQITDYAQSADTSLGGQSRTLTAYLDDVEILSANTPPAFSGSIISNPATSSTNKAISPATITFTAPTVTGYPAPTISWTNTANGQTATGSTASFTFQQAGTYTVTATATNSIGSATATTTVYIDGSLPTTDFYASSTTIEEGGYITFVLTSYSGDETYVWDFGDDSTSTAQQPNHQYTTAGTYTVTLQVTNNIGTQTITKENYITVTEQGSVNIPTGSGSMYSPHTVQISFVDMYGNSVSNMPVSVEQSGQFGVLSNILAFFGIQNGEAVTGTQRGTTGTDGAIVFAALPNLEYTIRYTYNDIDHEERIFPSGTDYVIVVKEATTIVTENPWDFSNTVSTDYLTINLLLWYSNPSTSSVYIYAKEIAGDMLYSQTLQGSTARLDVTVANTRGTEYEWGFIAYNSTGGIIHQDSRKVSATGNPDAPLWSFGFEEPGGIGSDWYFYIALGIMVLTGALFSVATVKQGAVVVTLFEGGIFLFVGWIPAGYAPLIALAGGLALLAISHKEGRELGFGSIILLIALAGAVIGLVNGSGLFGGGYATQYAVSDYSLDMQILGTKDMGIMDYASLVLTCGQTMLSMVWSIMQLFVFGIPMLIELGCPIALASIIQVAIWITATLWCITDLIPKIKG